MKILLNTLFWGLMLWLFGYVLGIVFFMFIPQEYLGWAITPFGIAFTLWVLIKMIKREKLMCYYGLAIIWTVMAVLLDYIFIVKLFASPDYYRLDVYLYYAITFTLPIAVGLYRFKVR